MTAKKRWVRRPKARQMSGDVRSTRRRLNDTYYPWNYRPGWEYEGADRVVMGHAFDPRCFSIKTQSINGIIWTIHDQAWAVEQGFFVQRELVRERPVIIAASRHKQDIFSYWEPARTMMEIERRVFRREHNYEKLYAFIEQQDKYGYTGAWDARCAVYSPRLVWYKLYVAEFGAYASQLARKSATIKAVRTRHERRLAATKADLQRRMDHAREVKEHERIKAIILGEEKE